MTDRDTSADALGFGRTTVAAARAGDQAALSTIWLALNPKLLRFIGSLGRLDADDVASQVWLEVVRNLPGTSDEPREFLGLLFTIARRRSIDARRRSLRRPEDPTDTVPHWVDVTADSADSVDAALDAVALLRRLDPALAELVALRVIVGCSHAEIAQITGRSEGSIRIATHRALRQLRNIVLADQGTAARVDDESGRGVAQEFSEPPVTNPAPSAMDQS